VTGRSPRTSAPTSPGGGSEGAEEPAPGTFAGLLTEEERAALEKLGVRRRFPRGSVLILENDPGQRVLLLLSGRVKVSRVDESGHELLLSIRDPGELLGELGAIDGLPGVADVHALDDVHALVMPAAAFRAHLETAPRVAVVLLEAIVRRFRETTVRRSQFTSSDTLGRLVGRILELADRYGQPGPDGIVIDLPISQEELGAWTGSSRAGVSQAMQTLRELGWIATGRRRIVVKDRDAMRARSA
jgi:CRP/FNR family transcriptional regulator, cyclic AMP receptor protein